MIPYVQVPEITIVPAHAFTSTIPEQSIAIRPFGTLVAIAVLTGAWLSLRQAQRVGLDRVKLIGLMYWVTIGGFLGGHVLDVAFYHPALIPERPALLLDLASGQSSFGGFVGATVGALLWRLVRRQSLLPYADVIASSFPAAWVIGRLGCAVAHDHPGIRSDLWFAVAYPGGPRLDLGLLEAFFVLPIALFALAARKKTRRVGYFVGFMCLCYAPIRFVLDVFRARDLASADARYVGLTPAQWGCGVVFGIGLYFSSRHSIAGRGSLNGMARQASPREVALCGQPREDNEQSPQLGVSRVGKTCDSKRMT